MLRLTICSFLKEIDDGDVIDVTTWSISFRKEQMSGEKTEALAEPRPLFLLRHKDGGGSFSGSTHKALRRKG